MAAPLDTRVLVRGARNPLVLVLVVSALYVLLRVWGVDRTRSTTMFTDVLVAVGLVYLLVGLLVWALVLRRRNRSIPFGIALGISAVSVGIVAVVAVHLVGPGPSVGFTSVPSVGDSVSDWWTFVVPLLAATPPVTVPFVAAMAFPLGLARTRRNRVVVVGLLAVPWLLGVVSGGVFFAIIAIPQYLVGGAAGIPLYLIGTSIANDGRSSTKIAG